MRLYFNEYNRGKFVLITAIVCIWLLIVGSFKYQGYEETWKIWNVPVVMPPFLDFRLIPGSAESFRNGFEPTISNPGDPQARIFNYPAFWRIFFYTGISLDDTVWIVVIMLVLFFAGVVLFPQNITIPNALWMLLIVFSPTSMLLYERGNVDLIVFFICVLIILAADYSASLAAGLIVFGAVVKMFPLFAVTALLKEPRKKFISLVLGCVASVLIYAYLTFESQSLAWSSTMRGAELSYGSFVVITNFNGYFQQAFPNLFSYDQWRLCFEVLAFVLICLAGILAVKERDVLDAAQVRNLTAFRVGASIYVGTFLLGNNWDYRLAFLILVIPQLSQWLYLENKRYRLIAIGSMAGVVLSCWGWFLMIDLPMIPLDNPADRFFLMDEFVNWLLLPGLAYLLVASLPVWLKEDLRKITATKKLMISR